MNCAIKEGDAIKINCTGMSWWKRLKYWVLRRRTPPIKAGTTYYVVGVTENTFKIVEKYD